MRLSHATAAVLAAVAMSLAAPAQACLCIPPDNLEAAARAALASADLVAELEIGRAPAPSRFWCRADGQARWWFRPGRKIDQDRAAHVIRVIKGRVSGPIQVRDNPVESRNGYCTVERDSCQIRIATGRTGPMLLRRVAPGVFEPLDACSQFIFADWYAQRRSHGPK